MPIYEYRCSSCGFQKEYLLKVSDPVMTVCPECNKQTFSKMLTAAGFHLKGSGWYATDFRNSGAKPAAKTEGKDTAKTEGKETVSADGKETARADGKETAKTDGKEVAKTESKTEAPSAGTGASPVSS
ncbi:MAG: zinc ribbon protein [Acidobacteria bacterium]|nr:zinc ribbon protein [Acidobacteriota bacterium]